MRQISKRIWNHDQTGDAHYEVYDGGEPVQVTVQNTRFKCAPEEVAYLGHTDNKYHEDKDDDSTPFRSSRMLIEKFGGMQGLADMLQTDLSKGIKGTPEDIKDRVEVFGKNYFQPPHLRGIWELIMENFNDFINQVLLGAAIVSVIIGEIQHPGLKGLLEGTSIMVALSIIIVVTSANNYVSEKRLADLIALADAQEVPVFRNSTDPVTIDAQLLLVGDVVAFKQGSKVPADMLIIESKDVTTREDELTGEPDDVEKHSVNKDNYLDGLSLCTMLGKSLVATGSGRALIVAVGERSVAGAIDAKTQEKQEGDGETHLQKKLGTIAQKIGGLGWAVAGLTLAGQIVRVALEYDQYFVPCGCMNLTSCQELDDPDMCEPLDFWKGRLWQELLTVVIVAITVVVVAIPEGLPLAVTISLSFSSAKMRELQNLVRTLASAETMGGATHICSDKTGTLTQNKMTVMGVATLGRVDFVQQIMDADDYPGFTKQVRESAITKTCGQTGGTVWDALQEGVHWNTDVFVEDKSDKDPTAQPRLVGNVTEKGLIRFFEQLIGFNAVKALQQDLPSRKLTDVGFTSSRKRASIVVRRPDRPGKFDEVRVYTKGAPDVLFRYTSHIVNPDGEVVPVHNTTAACEALWPASLAPKSKNEKIDGSKLATAQNADTLTAAANNQEKSKKDPNLTHMECLERTVKLFAAKSYRTILVAYRDMSMQEYERLQREHNDFAKEADREAALEQGLTAYGLFGLQDPLRPSIKSSIAQCRTSGIRVIMCTGDNIDTATAISLDAGIVTREGMGKSKYACMVGEDFRKEVGIKVKGESGNMQDAVDVKKFKKLNFANDLRVLARSSPLDKYLLVSGIQEGGGVVAVTGDGTNDAPALKKADVGFAMGITGTDVAKGASDIILLDDNFTSIIVALRYGRNVYDNVRKFLQFQLTVNVVAMFIVFFGSCILKDSPLTAVQMLWVNMIMDTFAALALATEPPEADILERQPYNKDAPIVTDVMWRNVNGHAIYQILVICVVIFAGQAVLCDHNYDQECLGVYGPGADPCDASVGGGGFNPFYSSHHYYEATTRAYWDGRVANCDDIESSLVNLNEGESVRSHYKTTEECERKTEPWKTDPDSQFNPEALAKFNCFYAEELWGDEFKDYAKEYASPDQAGDEFDCSNLADVRLAMPDFLAADGGARLADLDAERRARVDGQLLYPWDQHPSSFTQKALHFTYVFQIFVFMQIFNQVNARKLKEMEYNVFAGICDNKWFNVITALTFVVQILMVQFGGAAMKACPLSMMQNLACWLIGAGELIWGLLLKFVPKRYFQCISMDDKPMTEEQMASTFVSSLKPSMAGKKQSDKSKAKRIGAKGGEKATPTDDGFQREKR